VLDTVGCASGYRCGSDAIYVKERVMDKQREEFEKCYPLAVWDAELQGYTEEQYTYALVGWRQAHAEMQPEIDKLLHENNKFMWQVRDTCTRAEKAEQQLSADNQRIEELENENI